MTRLRRAIAAHPLLCGLLAVLLALGLAAQAHAGLRTCCGAAAATSAVGLDGHDGGTGHGGTMPGCHGGMAADGEAPGAVQAPAQDEPCDLECAAACAAGSVAVADAPGEDVPQPQHAQARQPAPAHTPPAALRALRPPIPG